MKLICMFFQLGKVALGGQKIFPKTGESSGQQPCVWEGQSLVIVLDKVLPRANA
jgi:hypothetical protein